MITKFIFSSLFFLIAAGVLLHLGVKVPGSFSWIGTLPGDFFVQRKDVIVYFPITSAGICGLVYSLFIWLCSKSPKKES